MRILITTIVVAVLAAATPAAAVATLNLDFGRASGTVNVASVSQTRGGIVFTATARLFTVLPGALTDLSQTSATGALIQQTVPGIGVDGGASSPQMDTNTADRREAILLSATQDFSLRRLKLSFIDNDDTLQIYGVNRDGSLVSLGYPGVIRAGLPGANASLSLLAGAATGPAFQSGLANGTQTLDLVNPTRYFDRFLFTSRERGDVAYLGTLGQGYRIDSLTVGVPEPASWALMILGFGLVGQAARRRAAVSA